MAWTAPRTWTTGELVTAAFLNTHLRDNLSYLAGFASDTETQDVNGFTNTAYADLDALTAAAFTNPVAVTATTGTKALIHISTTAMNINTSGSCFLAYRVSGASTIASSDANAARADVTGRSGVTIVHTEEGLTAGSNTFELQARVTANNGRITNPRITVIPLAS